MSLQISYKKQFVLGIFLLFVLLGVVEIFANVWLYNIYRCEFEDNEIFKDVDPETNRKVCLESLAYGFTKQEISWTPGTRMAEQFGGIDENVVNMNSEGFRGSEFTKNKPEKTYRIFILGGSTTFGSVALDNQT